MRSVTVASAFVLIAHASAKDIKDALVHDLVFERTLPQPTVLSDASFDQTTLGKSSHIATLTSRASDLPAQIPHLAVSPFISPSVLRGQMWAFPNVNSHRLAEQKFTLQSGAAGTVLRGRSHSSRSTHVARAEAGRTSLSWEERLALERSACDRMGIPQLKAALSEFMIPMESLSEKEDLVNALSKARVGDQPASSASSGNSTGARAESDASAKKTAKEQAADAAAREERSANNGTSGFATETALVDARVAGPTASLPGSPGHDEPEVATAPPPSTMASKEILTKEVFMPFSSVVIFAIVAILAYPQLIR